jgi:hypothetical protein
MIQTQTTISPADDDILKKCENDYSKLMVKYRRLKNLIEKPFFINKQDDLMELLNSSGIDDDYYTCSVCLDSHHEPFMKTTLCNHKFCRKCFDSTKFQKLKSCPICRNKNFLIPIPIVFDTIYELIMSVFRTTHHDMLDFDENISYYFETQENPTQTWAAGNNIALDDGDLNSFIGLSLTPHTNNYRSIDRQVDIYNMIKNINLPKNGHTEMTYKLRSSFNVREFNCKENPYGLNSDFFHRVRNDERLITDELDSTTTHKLNYVIYGFIIELKKLIGIFKKTDCFGSFHPHNNKLCPHFLRWVFKIYYLLMKYVNNDFEQHEFLDFAGIFAMSLAQLPGIYFIDRTNKIFEISVYCKTFYHKEVTGIYFSSRCITRRNIDYPKIFKNLDKIKTPILLYMGTDEKEIYNKMNTTLINLEDEIHSKTLMDYKYIEYCKEVYSLVNPI